MRVPCLLFCGALGYMHVDNGRVPDALAGMPLATLVGMAIFPVSQAYMVSVAVVMIPAVGKVGGVTVRQMSFPALAKVGTISYSIYRLQDSIYCVSTRHGRRH
jgi:peptidoglycan/LPS O-acetylase OafA/YrhL